MTCSSPSHYLEILLGFWIRLRLRWPLVSWQKTWIWSRSSEFDQLKFKIARAVVTGQSGKMLDLAMHNKTRFTTWYHRGTMNTITIIAVSFAGVLGCECVRASQYPLAYMAMVCLHLTLIYRRANLSYDLWFSSSRLPRALCRTEPFSSVDLDGKNVFIFTAKFPRTEPWKVETLKDGFGGNPTWIISATFVNPVKGNAKEAPRLTTRFWRCTTSC